MPIKHINKASAAIWRDIQREYALCFEEFGPPATGKTTRAESLAEQLSAQGKHVIVMDDQIGPTGESGVRVYEKTEKSHAE